MQYDKEVVYVTNDNFLVSKTCLQYMKFEKPFNLHIFMSHCSIFVLHKL